MSITTIESKSKRSGHLEAVLDEARKRIQVAEPELKEARDRRDDIADALKLAFPGAPVYLNGSVAHGDALTPLTDVDLGVIVPNPDNKYGPGRVGPTALQVAAANSIRKELKEKYGDLQVVLEGQKRSILIRFREPVRAEWKDFTADVIVAIDNPAGEGLFIPRYVAWDRSHPQKHTELVHAAIKQSEVSFARVVRLIKHWNRSNGKPLVSWHIKALALDCIDQPTLLIDGIAEWFLHAHDAIDAGPTPDPAHVSAPIAVEPGTKTDVLRKLRLASDGVQKALQHQKDGHHVLAVDELAKVFNDDEMLPRPSKSEVAKEYAERLRTISAVAPAAVSAVSLPPVRSWGC